MNQPNSLKRIDKLLEAIAKELSEDVSYWAITGVVAFPPKTAEKQVPDFKNEIFNITYIDQHCGCCEDDYFGEIYIPYEKDLYLKVVYVC